VIKRTLEEIQLMSKGTGLKEEHKHILIEGVSTDSRTIKEGQLFVPLIGEKFNGHRFIEQAVEKGAKASLWSKKEPLPDIDFPFILVEDTLLALHQLAKEYRNQLNIKAIGITGSNGKTTTKDITASLLSLKYKTKKTVGNYNNFVGVPLTILDLDEDTEMAVIEMGTEMFGELSTLTSIVRPDVAIITSIGEAHLEHLINKENVAKAKLEILEGLNPEGVFIYFGDDPTLKKVLKDYTIKHRTITYGTEEHNDYRCKLNNMDQKGLSFTLEAPIHKELYLPILGKHNMYNATAAIAVARYYDIPFELIQEGLNSVDKTGMRDELIYAKGFAILNDSYKSNPDSLLAALNTFYSMENFNQKIAVIGDMLGLGKDEIKAHERIGLAIDENQVDYLFTIGPLAKHIGDKAIARFGRDRIIHCESKRELIERLKEVIKPKSLLLVKASRSLELEEVVKAISEEVVFPENEAI
jgi:UDP-N-acetylmuramoyl-tripeptide--D-alanyl-D-alanine ligase